jgi:AcrR family transcriptional regulator
MDLMKKLRGRPDNDTLPLHRERLVKVASDEFLREGYTGANLDDIATKAGVSKVTIYRRYGNKAGLFEAVALRSVDKLRREYREIETQGREPADVLLDFGLVLYRGATRPETVAVVRLALAEAKQFPSVAKTLWDHRFETLGPLARYLDQLKAEGRLVIDDPMQATFQFSGLVSGGLGSVMDKPLRSAAARRRWVESAVELFLRGCLRRESALA